MGLLDNYLRLTDMTKKIEKETDVKASMAEMQSKMKNATQTMAAMNQQQAAAADPTSQARRVSATASVSRVQSAGVQMGQASMVELDFVVMLPAGVPVPVTISTLVQHVDLPRVQLGSRLAVTLDPKYPASLSIDWATIA